jgi:two-component system chemotaxis response regulator CheB
MIRVVVIDDLAVARKLVTRMLESDPGIKVIGSAMNGIFGLRRVYRDNPDVVTMDFEMPQMDGLETLSAVMDRRPTPVIMLSAHTSAGAELTMKALALGAVDFVAKPDGRQSEVLGSLCDELVAKVKIAARSHPRMVRRADASSGA